MKHLFVFILCVMSPSLAFAAEGKVIVSVKPLHSLVAAVMEGSGDSPMLLVEGKASPHNFSLKPSQAAALQKADIVFYIGDEYELFLQKILPTLPAKVTRVAMDKETQLSILPPRQGKDFGEDGHEVQGITGRGARDLHYWMVTLHAQAMVKEIARQLAMQYPSKRQLYFTNVKKINARLDQMHIEIEQRLVKLRGKPFIVFHDATQYFENDYNLKAAGSIMLHPEQLPGAKHIDELRSRIKTLGAVCVFREPSFDAKIVSNLIEGTQAKIGVLDPEGALLTPGLELYFQLIEGMAKALEDCLG